jgi:hypothetical protein
MTNHPAPSCIDDATDAFGQLAAYEPESPGEFDGLVGGLQAMCEELHTALQAWASKADDMPVEPGTKHALDELAAWAQAGAGFAEETYQQHRTDHEREMAREEGEYPNPQMWNVEG